jgi:hypothetical protein
MRAIKIDVARRELVEIEIPGPDRDQAQLTALQKVVGGYIELAVSFPNGDVIFVDEEGQLKHKQPAPGWFTVNRQPPWHSRIGDPLGPFAGHGVVTGSDADGNTVAAKISLQDLADLVGFLLKH